MKKLSYLILLFVVLACNNTSLELNVMTFNIRYDNPGDSLNNWQYRKDIAAEVIKSNNIDVLGAQEVLHNQLNDLKTRLPEYNAIGVGREDGKTQGEYSPILYNTNKLTEESSGLFWLSETPEIAGSKGWDGACERIAVWAILKNKETNKSIFFINTHLDHIGKIARTEGVKLLLKRTKELSKGLPVIITGDFNASSQADVIKQITENGILKDTKFIAKSVTEGIGTFHGFGKVPPKKRETIDFIFVNSNVEVTEYKVLPDKLKDIYISDHNPIIAQIKIK